MTGLNAPPDDSTLPSVDVAADGAGGFYPAVSTDHVRKRVRIGEGAVTDARLQYAIEGAILSAMRALENWRAARIDAGAATLPDVTQDTINGENLAEALWTRAVTFYAAADIADMHVDVSATDEAIDRDEEKRDTADTYRRNAYHAIADLLAIGAVTAEEKTATARNRVELI